MATGDAAAAAGLSVVAPTDDARLGYDAINRRGDELANHMTSGTHKWSQIAEKPTTFPPSAHTHAASTIPTTGSNVQTDLNFLSTSKADKSNTYTTSQTYSRDQVDTAFVARDSAIAGRAFAYGGDPNNARFSDGPTGDAFNRTVGGNRFATWMSDDGGVRVFGRSVSSRRYKDEIEAHEVDVAAVLELEPVTYHYKSDEPGVREFGLIAEDVHDAGLPEIVTRFNGRIDGIRYDLLSVALLAVVKAQHAELEALAARVDLLEQLEPDPTTDPTTTEE
jgi:hypothetical protein